MIFTIEDIIHKKDLIIRFLTYPDQPISSLDLTILTNEEIRRFNSFGSKKRQLEFFFTRVLWQDFPCKDTITYNESGRPKLTEGFLSISHSKNQIAIGYSPDHRIGLDIEHFNPKIDAILPKFLSREEMERFDLTDPLITTTLWSIKEAIYKFADFPGLSFRDNICILAVGKQNEARLQLPKKTIHFSFDRLIFDHFLLTYCNSSVIRFNQ